MDGTESETVATVGAEATAAVGAEWAEADNGGVVVVVSCDLDGGGGARAEVMSWSCMVKRR